MMEENMDCGLVGWELENGETDHHVDDFHRTSPQRHLIIEPNKMHIVDLIVHEGVRPISTWNFQRPA